ncbi:MAG: hypothetical protein K2P53_00250 [Rickettsiales bacterium]|jgi:hypothetical protein|nr:hypothetical protein [Rickettsiales bacterium]
MNKLVKYTFLILLFLIVLKIIHFDNKPFKFEEYKTSSEFTSALNDNFAGKNLKEVERIMEASCAKCEISKNKIRCYYEKFNITQINYLCYESIMYSDDNNKIVKIKARRFYDLAWP